jgi:hypothetical protein
MMLGPLHASVQYRRKGPSERTPSARPSVRPYGEAAILLFHRARSVALNAASLIVPHTPHLHPGHVQCACTIIAELSLNCAGINTLCMDKYGARVHSRMLIGFGAQPTLIKFDHNFNYCWKLYAARAGPAAIHLWASTTRDLLHSVRNHPK